MAAESVVARLEAVASRLESLAGRFGKGGSSSGDEKSFPAVDSYRDYYQSAVVPFINTCRTIAGLKKTADQTETAFHFLETVIEAACVSKQPPQPEFVAFIKPIIDVVSAAQNCDNRDAYYNHQKAFAEMIQLMNWVMMPGPVQVVLATLEAAEFYLNKVLVFAKDKSDPEKQHNRDFVTQTKTLINELAEYVKQYHKMGLSWAPQGKALSEFHKGAGAAAPPAPKVPSAPAVPAAPGIPPPPPMGIPPPPPVGAAPAAAAEAPKTKVGGMAAVFEEINKRKDAAAVGLTHVTKEMKKTVKDKPAPVVAAPAAAKKETAAPQKAVEEKKAPSLVRKLGTWFCENWENKNDLVIDNVEMKESVYIYKCNNSFIHVKGKVKSIQIDGCFKTTIVCESVVSTFEVVNGKRITLQVLNQCPSVVVDKTNGCHIHLTAEVMASGVPTIVSSMASEINISTPGPDGADPVEQPIPEQFQTIYKNGSWATEPVAHSAN